MISKKLNTIPCAAIIPLGALQGDLVLSIAFFVEDVECFKMMKVNPRGSRFVVLNTKCPHQSHSQQVKRLLESLMRY
jgi:hypothetical protein